MFWQFVLAVHIVAVVAAFGATFAYPLFILAAEKYDKRATPLIHRLQQLIGRRLISPGLGVVLICGIYLASDLHQWKEFYVQWALAVVIILGGLEGGFMVKQEGKLAELAERDIAAAGSGEVVWGEDSKALRTRVGAVGSLMVGLVVITVYLMAVGPT
jgi:uncharacterized membrane protein